MTYLGPINTDDTICGTVTVIVKWHINRPITGRDPILFGLWVYVKHMRFCGKYRLLTENRNIFYLIMQDN